MSGSVSAIRTRPEEEPVQCAFWLDLTNGKRWASPASGTHGKTQRTTPAAELHDITTEANKLMALVHDRMPVILHPGDFNRWLDREESARPIDLLRPFPADEMETFDVSKGSVLRCRAPTASEGE
jgi:putative SOS response-associated peptidase YedK